MFFFFFVVAVIRGFFIFVKFCIENSMSWNLLFFVYIMSVLVYRFVRAVYEFRWWGHTFVLIGLGAFTLPTNTDADLWAWIIETIFVFYILERSRKNFLLVGFKCFLVWCCFLLFFSFSWRRIFWTVYQIYVWMNEIKIISVWTFFSHLHLMFYSIRKQYYSDKRL